MGGKGGGGGNYYQMGPDTSGYGTLEEAEATLARQKPLDLSAYQQNINVKRAAAENTAPTPIPQPGSPGGGDLGTQFTDAVLKPPAYWSQPTSLKPQPVNKSRIQTVQS